MNAFQTALRLTPTYAPAYNEWASVLLDLGRYEEALRAFQQALERDPDYTHSLDELGIVCLERHFGVALRGCESPQLLVYGEGDSSTPHPVLTGSVRAARAAHGAVDSRDATAPR